MTGIKRGLLFMLTVAIVLLSAAGLTQPARADSLSFGITYKSSTVNLRQQPTQYSTRLGSYASGSWMAISGESGNWYYVTAPDGKTGYMSKNYVSVVDPTYATVGIVTNPPPTTFLNLRAKPSLTANVLGIYYNGAPCVLLSYSDGWYNVRIDGIEGYFREEYVSRQTLPFSEDVATIVTPNNTMLNLRAGPGTGYTSLKQYPGGSYVMVLQRGTDWWKVSIDGMVGFMSTTFLQEGLLEPGKTSGSTATGSGYAVVTNPRSTQVLNLRESASTASRVLGQYKNGVRLTVLAQGAEWCRVMTEQNITGYMMTQYLTLYNLPSTPIMTVNHPQKTYVNLRTSPSITGGRVLAKVPHGATVTVLIPGDGWIKVRYNGQTGYMMAYFLE